MCLLAESLADQNLLYELDLVLTEACANVVRHAYPGGDPGDMEIVLGIEPGVFVQFEVADRGVGMPAAIRFDNPAPAAESGRGLYIISRLVDRMEIRRRGRKNIVFFRKEVGKEQWKACT